MLNLERKNSIRVGILHSLTGTMAISEKPVKDAALMAIAEINQAGGILGDRIEPIIADGASKPLVFADRARKLIQEDRVKTLFGCWTSASRKAVLPVVEELNTLLWYPVQYEGLEESKNIFYTGSCVNQQIDPALDWLLKNQRKKFYLLGSDYVFPRIVNLLIKNQLPPLGGAVVSEDYIPLGDRDFSASLQKIKQLKPDVIFNTLNGDSNLAFYRQYQAEGLQAKEMPIMAVSLGENEMREIGQAAVGHYAAWSYFQSLDTPSNQRFVENFKARYGDDRLTSDPMEAAYFQVYLWKQAVETANSFEVKAVRQAAYHQTWAAPSGLVRIGKNHHIWKYCRIGQVLANGQFEQVFATPEPIAPTPWLGVEYVESKNASLAIKLLKQVPQSIQYNCELEEKTRQVKEVMEQMETSLSLLHTTLEATADGILAFNREDQILIYNQKLLKIWEICESWVATSKMSELLNTLAQQLEEPESFGQEKLWHEPKAISSEIFKLKNGRILERYTHPQCSGNKIIGQVWSFRDITTRYQSQEIMRYQAWHDQLTGLPNRILFNDRLENSLIQAKERQGMLAVMFLDLDRFKIINDTLGHAVGDRLLEKVSQRLIYCLREYDTVARWGGDEFIILLPQIHSEKDAIQVAERILQTFDEVFHIESHELYVKTSIGISLYPLGGQNSDNLVKNADSALYQAKELGRNTYQVYSPEMNAKAVDFLNLENNLHHALERGEFVVYYQPQVNIHQGKVLQMEALVRWQHPEFGLICPVTFLNLAEQSGLILSLGKWVLKTACKQCKAWLDAGFSISGVTVNLSLRQLQRSRLLETVEQVLAETGLNSQFLELEMTEKVVMQNLELSRSIFAELSQIGIKISLDDFGLGYSSLVTLKQLPINTLKIGNSFIHDITDSEIDTAIVQAVIALGKGLNFRVVAEGVESKTQKKILQKIGCSEMQGYLFSVPVDAEKATNMLKKNIYINEDIF